MQITKTAQLAVIILALEILRQHGLRHERMVSAAARRLEVSRKAGYEAAKRLREELTRGPEESEQQKLERENAVLRIGLQIRTYERDHPGVLFADRRGHLPLEAKSLCVRLLRDFEGRLTKEEIAEAIGVPPASLRRWAKEAGEDGKLPEKEETRGKHRHHREEDEKRVLDLWGKLEEPTTLAGLAARYRKENPERPLDPKTIGRILERHGLRALEAKERAVPYRDKVEVFFPGAQAAVDATECKVQFTGHGNEEAIKLKEEVAIDIATGAILGTALRSEEDSEGVERVVVLARKECESLLAVLSDNGKANRSSAVKRVVEDETPVGSIFSFPKHPWTNGHMEGSFGAFKKIVGKLEIDDTTRESTARSVLLIIWAIYCYFHNYSPRERLAGVSPIDYLRRYAPRPEEVEEAREALSRRKARSASFRGPHPRLSDGAYCQLVERILAEHRFEVDPKRALESLLPYDTAVIASSSRAFFLASGRDGFDERKRTFAYFVGIARSKQREVDTARLRDRVISDRSDELTRRYDGYKQAAERDRRREQEDLQARPERVILEAAKLLLAGGLRFMLKTSLSKIRAGFDRLERLGRNTSGVLAQCALEIMSWSRYGEEAKRELIELFEREAREARARVSPSRSSPSSAAGG